MDFLWLLLLPSKDRERGEEALRHGTVKLHLVKFCAPLISPTPETRSHLAI